MYGITETSITRSPIDCVIVCGATCERIPVRVCPLVVVVVVLIALNSPNLPEPTCEVDVEVPVH